MNSQDSVLQLRNILYEKKGSIAYLTMACTIRLAADTAKFGQAEGEDWDHAGLRWIPAPGTARWEGPRTADHSLRPDHRRISRGA